MIGAVKTPPSVHLLNQPVLMAQLLAYWTSTYWFLWVALISICNISAVDVGVKLSCGNSTSYCINDKVNCTCAIQCHQNDSCQLVWNIFNSTDHDNKVYQKTHVVNDDKEMYSITALGGGFYFQCISNGDLNSAPLELKSAIIIFNANQGYDGYKIQCVYREYEESISNSSHNITIEGKLITV